MAGWLPTRPSASNPRDRHVRTYIHTYIHPLHRTYLPTYTSPTCTPRVHRHPHPHPNHKSHHSSFPAPNIAPGRPKAYTVSMCLVCRSRPTEGGTVSGGLIFPNLPPAHLPRHRSCYGLCPPLSLADSATCVLESLTLCVRRKVSRLPTYLPNYL